MLSKRPNSIIVLSPPPEGPINGQLLETPMTSCVIYRLFHHQVTYCHPPGEYIFGRICCKSCDTSPPGKCKIPAESSFTSRNHCRLEYNSQGKWTLEDIGSSNGTYCNHQLLNAHQKITLRNGDLISLGVDPKFVDLKVNEDLSHRKYIFYKFYDDSDYGIKGSTWDTTLKDQLLSSTKNIAPTFSSVWERQNIFTSWPVKIPLSHKSATESDIQKKIDLLHLCDRHLFEQTIPQNLVRWIPGICENQPMSPGSMEAIEQTEATNQNEHPGVDDSNTVDSPRNSLPNPSTKPSRPEMIRWCTILLTESFQLDALGQLQFEPALAKQLHRKCPASVMSHSQMTTIKRRLRFKLRRGSLWSKGSDRISK